MRKQVVVGARNQRRHSFGVLDGIMKILIDNEVSLFGRVWVKAIGVPIDGRALYTSSIQSICAIFQNYLTATQDLGMVLLDSRWQTVNVQVAHSIFTQKFRFSGDAFDRIVDLPGFAHSDNHAGLQICDIIVSSLIFPISTFTYCSGHVTGIHVSRSMSSSRIDTRRRSMVDSIGTRKLAGDGVAALLSQTDWRADMAVCCLPNCLPGVPIVIC